MVRIPSWIDVLSWLVLVFLYDTSPVVESTAYFFPIRVGRSLHSVREGGKGGRGGGQRRRIQLNMLRTSDSDYANCARGGVVGPWRR